MTYESELEEIEHKNQMVDLVCDHIINWNGVGVCAQPLQGIKEVYRNAMQPEISEEEKTVRELEERTHRNMELISAFCEHVERESGVVIDKSIVLSFFDA